MFGKCWRFPLIISKKTLYFPTLHMTSLAAPPGKKFGGGEEKETVPSSVGKSLL